MNQCCFRAPAPATLGIQLDFEEKRPIEIPGEALDTVTAAVSPLTIRGLKSLLTKVQDRQEQQFEQVLDRLNAFQSQVELIQSTLKATEVPDETMSSEPPLTSGGIRVLLTDLRDRQDHLFKQGMEQQKVFEKQFVAIESAIWSNCKAQESFKAEFHRFFPILTSKYMSKDADADIQKYLPTSSVMTSEEKLFKPEGNDEFEANVSPRGMERQESPCSSDPPSSQSPASPISTLIRRSKLSWRSNPSCPDLGRDRVAPDSSYSSGKKSFHDSSSSLTRKSFASNRGESRSSSNHSVGDSALKRSLSKNKKGREKKKGILGSLDNLLCSERFELAIAAAILINAFVMCMECQYTGLDVGYNLQYPGRSVEAHDVWIGADTVFICFDWLFGGMFLVELMVKLTCWRCRYFYALPDDKAQTFTTKPLTDEPWPHFRFLSAVQFWNLLDFLTVVAFTFEKIQAAAGFAKPQMIRLLRLFRLGRLVRLLRFVESLDQLYVMTTAISGLRQALGWAIVLLTLLLLMCDLLLVELLHVTYFDQVEASELTDDKLEKYHEMYAYFGTCTRCMLSMFEITLGNWPPVARLLSEEVSEFFILACLVHKLTIGFAVVGVITGCILEETFKVARTDDIIMYRQKKKAGQVFKMKMQALFEALDKSKDGKMTVNDMLSIASSFEIQTWLSSLNIEVSDLRTLFDLLDFEGRGYITLDELQMRMPRIQGNARSIDVLAIQKQMWKNDQKSRQTPDSPLSPGSPHKPVSSFADFLYKPKPDRLTKRRNSV